jgi:hypothetical protein
MPGDELSNLKVAVQKNESDVKELVSGFGDMKKKVDELPNIMTGVNDIKNMISVFGERLAQAESDARVCRDVLRDVLLETRAREYHAQVEAKLARPASLVLSRPNNSDSPPPTSVDDLTDFINDKFADSEAPDFVIEPMGKRGSYKLIPETYSPMEGRRICAAVLQAVKPNVNINAGKRAARGDEETLKSRFGLNIFYDNPVFLREIRSTALRFVAQFLQAEGLKLVSKPFVKRDILLLNDIPMFPEYLVPGNEGLWPSAFPFLATLLRNPPVMNTDSPPAALSVMEDLFVAGKGLLFPKVTLPMFSPQPEPMNTT